MDKKLNKKDKKDNSNKYLNIEIVFFIGVFIITFTNFLVNFMLGLYFLGLILVAYSIFLYKFNGK
jgi:hypothetical protein